MAGAIISQEKSGAASRENVLANNAKMGHNYRHREFHSEYRQMHIDTKTPSPGRDSDPENCTRDELVRLVREQRQALDALNGELDGLRMITENVSDNIWILDLATLRFSYTTPSSVNILGYGPDEVDALTLERIITPRSLAEAMLLLQDELARDGRPGVDPDRVLTHLFEQIHRDGSIRWVDIQLRFLRDAAGAPRAIMGVSRDVTERRLAEQALRESEERFRLLAEKNPTGIVVHTEGRIVYVNDFTVKSFGAASADELIGRPALDFVHPDYRAGVVERVVRILKEGGSAEPMEEKFLTADGRIIDVEVTGVPIMFKDRPSVMVLIHNVTEKKAMERELVQARRLDSIGRLAGGIAHDLNNMLTPVLGYASMLVHAVTPGTEEHESLMQIEKAAERAKNLTMQLLTFSRKRTIDLKAVSLGRVVRDFEPILRRTIREDIRIELGIGAEGLLVMADVSQIEQILINLAVNAEEAMPDGGVFTISLEPVNRPSNPAVSNGAAGIGVALTVGDTGRGMDAETLEHAFEPFYTTRSNGTGLGLATVYGIVRQHDAAIDIRSAPGAGTAVVITFPAVEGREEEMRAQRPSMDSPAAGITILVVEDEEAVLRLAERILGSVGYRVLTASNGPDALAAAERHAGPIDLLLTDVIMPGMDGKRLYESLGRRHAGLPVVFMSGHHRDVLAGRDIDSAGTGFIQKPFTAPELIRQVRDVLGKR